MFGRYSDRISNPGTPGSSSVTHRRSLRSCFLAGVPANAAEYRGAWAGSPCHCIGIRTIVVLLVASLGIACQNAGGTPALPGAAILNYDDFSHHVDRFNAMENENV